jgi:hypothetical protein
MNPDIFSQEEQKQLLECVAAIQELPIYESTEFEAVFGLSRDEVGAVLEAFPEWDLYDEGADGTDHSKVVLDNTFAFLLNVREEDSTHMLSKLSFARSDLDIIYDKIRNL